ncbi:hypothetical protein Y600_6451 [Burkholderia pseudomallei MSHR3709]|nr:hypothetical protein Y600_6451 [Burkholderia pseudomallei MSHR3709]
MNGRPSQNEKPAHVRGCRRIGLLTFIRLLVFRSIEHLAFCNTSSARRRRIIGVALCERALDERPVAAPYVTTARWSRRPAIAARGPPAFPRNRMTRVTRPPFS